MPYPAHAAEFLFKATMLITVLVLLVELVDTLLNVARVLSLVLVVNLVAAKLVVGKVEACNSSS